MLWACISCRNWPWTARCVNGAIPTHRWRCFGGPAQRRQLQAVNPAARALGLARSIADRRPGPEPGLRHGGKATTSPPWSAGRPSSPPGPTVSARRSAALIRVRCCWKCSPALPCSAPGHASRPACAEELTALRLPPSPVPGARTRWRRGSWRTATTALAIEDETALQRQLSALPLDRLGLSAGAGLSPSDAWDCAVSAPGPRVAARAALARQLPGRTAVAHRPPLQPAAAGASAPAAGHLRLAHRTQLRRESHQAPLFPRRLSADLAAFLAGRERRAALHPAPGTSRARRQRGSRSACSAPNARRPA
ncbi:hypothetical protein ACPA9J_27900 [Pseudomonas aeruginosa]